MTTSIRFHKQYIYNTPGRVLQGLSKKSPCVETDVSRNTQRIVREGDAITYAGEDAVPL